MAAEELMELAAAKKLDMKAKTLPALKNGSAGLDKNVKFGDKAAKTSVKPDDVKKNFADSA